LQLIDLVILLVCDDFQL